jgi:hypothetical protein
MQRFISLKQNLDLYMSGKLTRLSHLFMVMPILLLYGFFASNTAFIDNDSYHSNNVFAQLTPQSPLIEIVSTSTFIDDFGSLHIVGEVNNTSFDPQTNVIVGTLFYNLTTNELVGNYSAFTSMETLRTGELSPYHIVVDDPQILGNAIEFFTSSQSGQAKPPNLVLNVTSTFVDEMGNPHIAGNIINQGFLPESFANLVATYYDNSSLGVIGTETFGLDLGNISQGQMMQFDLGIFDNRTKNQAQFFSLNTESNESSMDFPLNLKWPLFTTFDGGFDNTATSGLFGDPLIDFNQGFSSNNFDNNVGQTTFEVVPRNETAATNTTNNTTSSDSESQNGDNGDNINLSEQQGTQQPSEDDISAANEVSDTETSSDEGNGSEGSEGSSNNNDDDEGNGDEEN